MGEENKRVVDLIKSGEAAVLLQEGSTDDSRQITAIGLKADITNGNGRRYPREAVVKAVADAQKRIAKGEQILSVAPANSPLDKEHPYEQKYFNVNVNWHTIAFDNDTSCILLKGAIIPTDAGQKLLTVLSSGVKLGISMVSKGRKRQVTEPDGRNGRVVTEIDDFIILRFDVVLDQSDKNAKIIALESLMTNMDNETTPSSENPTYNSNPSPDAGQVAQGNQVAPSSHSFSSQSKQGSGFSQRQMTQKESDELAEANLKLSQAAFEREEIQRQLLNYQRKEEETKIKEALNKEEALWTYPADTKARLRRKIEEGLEKTEPSYTKFMELLRQEKTFVEGLLSSSDILRGRNSPISQGSQLYGISIDETPIHAGLSTILMESAVKFGTAKEFGRSESTKRSENLARQLVNLFDARYKPELEAEYRRYQEATSIGDVKGIYSAARFILAQGYAQAKAPNVFDVQAFTSGGAPVATWVEIVDDTRLELPVAAAAPYAPILFNELITTAALKVGEPYPLLHKNIIFNAALRAGVIGGGAWGTDHYVDTNNGTYVPLTALGCGATAINYRYRNFSPGDGLVNLRKAITHQAPLSPKHITLGYNITREALVSSKQSYGNENQMAIIDAITNELVIEKDTQIFNMAMAKAMSGIGNFVGNHQATAGLGYETPDHFANLIGTALGVLEGPGRNIPATAIAMGSSNLALLSQYMNNRSAPPLSGTTMENGFVSMFNGVPVYRVNSMPADVVLICDRQLVLDRIFNPIHFVVADAPGIGYDPTGSLTGGIAVGYTSTSTSILAEESCSVATVGTKATYITVS